MKHFLIEKARRWLSNPHNRERLKRGARSAWQSIQENRRGRSEGPSDDASNTPRRRR